MSRDHHRDNDSRPPSRDDNSLLPVELALAAALVDLATAVLEWLGR